MWTPPYNVFGLYCSAYVLARGAWFPPDLVVMTNGREWLLLNRQRIIDLLLPIMSLHPIFSLQQCGLVLPLLIFLIPSTTPSQLIAVVSNMDTYSDSSSFPCGLGGYAPLYYGVYFVQIMSFALKKCILRRSSASDSISEQSFYT